ncbi:TPA: hypothetical protein ACUNCG_003283 [Aeromonas hydrophila]
MRNPHTWLIISIPIGGLILIGAWLASGDDMISLGWGFIVMGGGLALYFRYLVMADKDYHYRLTSEGLIAIYQDAIPDVAYKIVRGLAWLGVLVYQARYPWSVLVVWHFLQFSLLILKRRKV